ncbi:hypothetical protein ACFS5L_25875 [Streptomyces phyllanthi]|uniref:Integral membrane protein n=1 Tax=Streptomyces phyllanthi TaxID=1803180 RepID=A0A5N8W0S0_9ACTN|nr:hypothetical protein [Streptomyces phyllanthi]MPY39888.1 hypothetical protein [Streptomyces phyllanthi]
MPSSLKWGVGLLWVQGALAVLSGVTLWIVAADAADHGQEGTGLLTGLAIFYVGLGVVLAVAAGLAPGRWRAVRIVATAVQILNVVGGVIGVTSGALQFLAGIALALVVIRAFNSAEAKAWFNH